MKPLPEAESKEYINPERGRLEILQKKRPATSWSGRESFFRKVILAK